MKSLKDRVFALTKTTDYVTAKKLSRVLGMPPANISNVLGNLYHDGYLDREKVGHEYLYLRKKFRSRPRKHTKAYTKKPKQKEAKSADSKVLSDLIEAIEAAKPVLKKYKKMAGSKLSDLIG